MTLLIITMVMTQMKIPNLGFKIKCLFFLSLYDVDLLPSVYSAYLKLNNKDLDERFETEDSFPYIKIKVAIFTTILHHCYDVGSELNFNLNC